MWRDGVVECNGHVKERRKEEKEVFGLRELRDCYCVEVGK